MESLKVYDIIPEQLLTCKIEELHDILGGPSIIDIKGESSDDALFVSTLLHANETTSFLVLQKLLKDFVKTPPKRDVVFFIGNTIAAKHGQRHLPDQPDYNRIWGDGVSEEHGLARQVSLYAEGLNLMGNIDIHNNTGTNPFYACVNVVEDNYLKLARVFSDKIVFFTEPSEVQSMKFAHFCPSVTIEAGMPGNKKATKEVYDFIQTIINTTTIEALPLEDDFDLFHTVGRIKVDKGSEINFTNESKESDLTLRADLDRLNFNLLPEGEIIGDLYSKGTFMVMNNRNQVVTSEYFELTDTQISVKKSFYPAMLTKDIYVMKEDCLGYIMEKMNFSNSYSPKIKDKSGD